MYCLALLIIVRCALCVAVLFNGCGLLIVVCCSMCDVCCLLMCVRCKLPAACSLCVVC